MREKRVMEINSTMIWLLIGTLTAMCTGTLVRIVALRTADADLRQKRLGSLKVWWVLALLMALATVFGRSGASALLAVASWLGLREFLNLIGRQRIGTPGVVVAFAFVPLQYLLIAFGLAESAKIVLPMTALLLLSIVRLMTAKPDGFIRSTAGAYWGVMLLVYGLSHAALLFTLPIEHVPAVGVAGWFLFVVIVTAAFLGDINMSAIKRDVGVKDGSTLLPGMGGMIDRIDSLTFTAPVFYYFVRWVQ